MNIIKVEYDGIIASIRPDTSDDFVMKETDYDIVQFDKSDMWLDVGANIGAFPMKYHKLVDGIISFEPDPDNYHVLRMNTQQLNNVAIYQAALINTDENEVDLHVNLGENKGRHSLLLNTLTEHDTLEITVSAYNIQSMAEKYKANCCKMDVEGYEAHLLFYLCQHGYFFDKLIFEAHFKGMFSDYKGHISYILHSYTSRGYKIDKVNEDKEYETMIYYLHK